MNQFLIASAENVLRCIRRFLFISRGEASLETSSQLVALAFNPKPCRWFISPLPLDNFIALAELVLGGGSMHRSLETVLPSVVDELGELCRNGTGPSAALISLIGSIWPWPRAGFSSTRLALLVDRLVKVVAKLARLSFRITEFADVRIKCSPRLELIPG